MSDIITPSLTDAERHADTERNRILNSALTDLDGIINGHDPEADTSINNMVWNRLDKMAVEIETRELLAYRADDDLRAENERLKTDLAVAEAAKAAHKSRGDSHWETMLCLYRIATEEGDMQAIIQHIRDAGSGYTERPEETLRRYQTELAAALAEMAEAAGLYAPRPEIPQAQYPIRCGDGMGTSLFPPRPDEGDGA